jgi:hypothetical protein
MLELNQSETSKLRKTASTKLNSNSSRSHAILTFHVRSYDRAGNLIKEGSIRVGTSSLHVAPD